MKILFNVYKILDINVILLNTSDTTKSFSIEIQNQLAKFNYTVIYTSAFANFEEMCLQVVHCKHIVYIDLEDTWDSTGIHEFQVLAKSVRILYVTTVITKSIILDTFKVGCKGIAELHYFLTNVKEVMSILQSKTGFYISPNTTKYLLEKNMTKPMNFVKYLTNKENIVAACLQKGYSYKEICDYLSLSLNTVRMHVKNIYKKVNVNSKSNLVLFLEKNNIQLDVEYKVSSLRNRRTQYKLTRKEKQIFEFIQKGYTPQEIATITEQSLHTITVQIQTIKTKITSNFVML